MKHPLRAVGGAGAVLTLVLLAADAARHSSTAGRPAGESHPGFPVEMSGLGRAETTFLGRVEMLAARVATEPDGRRLRIPVLRVVWRDPRPDSEGWMRGTDVEVSFYEDDGTTVAFTVAAPSARVAVDPAAGRPAVDLSRRWVLEEPRLRSTRFVPGRLLVVEAEEALLDPSSGALETPGRFQVTAEGLELEGFKLRSDPGSGLLAFGGDGEAGQVTWRFQDQKGRLWTGESDDGGRFVPSGQHGRMLVLPARGESLMVFPEDAPLPGSLRTGGLSLLLEPRGDGWRPVSAEGAGFTRWQGQDGWMSGGPSGARWDSGGVFLGVTIEGPVAGLFQNPAPAWVSARGGGHLEPVPGTREQPGRRTRIYLHGGAWVERGGESILAGWIRWQPDVRRQAAAGDGLPVAGGGVRLESRQGTAWCSTLWGSEHRGWRMEGGVLLFPAAPPARTVWAPQAFMDPAGRARLEGGFQMQGGSEAEQWHLEGRHLVSSERWGVRRTQARGGVLWSWADRDLAFSGEELLLVSGKRELVELTGLPATAHAQLGASPAALQSARMVLQGGALLLSGDPVIILPAASLQLEGPDVKVRAQRMRREEEGTWRLTGEVSLSGGLEGSAHSAVWHPDGSLELEGGVRKTLLEGRRAGAGHFRLEAERISLEPGGAVGLEGRSSAELSGGGWDLGPLAGEASLLRISGENARLSPSGGWFSGSPVIEAGGFEASALRLEWEADGGAPVRLHLLGRARASGPSVAGEADRIHYRPVEAVMRLVGRPGRLAELRLATGRVVEGEWLEFDLLNYLVSGGRGSSTGTPP